MAKTRRLISENLSAVDIVIELLDARIPASSRNPEIDKLTAGKPRLVLLTKSSLADPTATDRWIRYLSARADHACLAIDTVTGTGVKAIAPAVREILADKLRRYAKKGMEGRQIRAMVVGIPNVGKSSFINRMAKGGSAKVENRPGVTRGNQWFSLGKGYELLDTPGVLWPKFDDRTVGERLAFTGAVKDEVLDSEQLAARLAWILWQEHRTALCERYKLKEDTQAENGFELLEAIARRRGMLISGGEVDTERASATLLEEFRAGKIGKITLERCE
jgi:ribosome biogenesis GTPase A